MENLTILEAILFFLLRILVLDVALELDFPGLTRQLKEAHGLAFVRDG
jgi:hypothetical protein